MEDQGTGPFREEGGYPIDHIGGDSGGQESGSESGGSDVVEHSFDVQDGGGDFQSGSLEGFVFDA